MVWDRLLTIGLSSVEIGLLVRPYGAWRLYHFSDLDFSGSDGRRQLYYRRRHSGGHDFRTVFAPISDGLRFPRRLLAGFCTGLLKRKEINGLLAGISDDDRPLFDQSAHYGQVRISCSNRYGVHEYGIGMFDDDGRRRSCSNCCSIGFCIRISAWRCGQPATMPA